MTPEVPIDVEVVFSIGSNCGDRHTNVKAGIEWLAHIISDFKVSPIYATPDCLGSQKEYINAVAKGASSLSAEKLESLCKKYESSCGRNDETRKSNLVPIDIDLVVYGPDILRPRDFSREFFQIGFKSV
ncbi:MAG: 2-amino-4-hydroxy-6-hydroxymethyldihydropteridine diphosphokinase [Muribaculaceae bacterium]|nr:2-amino-4-hydroxy-6-hydroxymethyldihydropteridine diphosphokinase [Muribaculaceae bacterium]